MRKIMRLPFKRVIAVVLVLFSFYVIAGMLFAVKCRDLIAAGLQKRFQREVSIRGAAVFFPYNLRLKDLAIEDLIKIDALRIYPDIAGFFRGKVVLNRLDIINPELTLFRHQNNSEGSEVLNSAYGKNTLLPGASGVELNGAGCRRIFVKGGRLNFIDRKLKGEEINIAVCDIDAKLEDFFLTPSPRAVSFEAGGNIVLSAEAADARISLRGWFDFRRKDLQAELKVENIDSLFLQPYYEGFLDLKKANIEKIRVDFTSSISGRNKGIVAVCRLGLSDVCFYPLPEGKEMAREQQTALLVLDVFDTLDKGNFFLDFTIETNMDNPEIDTSVIARAFEDKLSRGLKIEKFKTENILVLPGKILKTAFKNAVKISRSLIAGTAVAGEELKSNIVDSFIKIRKVEPGE